MNGQSGFASLLGTLCLAFFFVLEGVWHLQDRCFGGVVLERRDRFRESLLRGLRLLEWHIGALLDVEVEHLFVFHDETGVGKVLIEKLLLLIWFHCLH